ncbi:hypothetical protein LAZ67_9002024 [Cordylochernes scorpioides]|uniref:RNase H type-1 domain-containing protein n=1 Tax=Cordylochernes scorpioides TaxID=51811 RepID=A0ABY6KTK0_9ARAC|nr:hypothetical protein LAZ67_9002024 [Cordylochernes scorpioides]
MFSGSFVNDPWGSLHKFIKKGSQNPNPLSSTSFEKNLLSHSVPKYLNSILIPASPIHPQILDQHTSIIQHPVIFLYLTLTHLLRVSLAQLLLREDVPRDQRAVPSFGISSSTQSYHFPFPPGVHAQAFADDLQLVIHGDPNNLKEIAQISITLIIEWCLDNKLTLSPNKSSILPIFCSEPTIHIQNSIIPCVEDITILGVNFNSRFSFSPHLNKICDNISISSPDFALVQTAIMDSVIGLENYFTTPLLNQHSLTQHQFGLKQRTPLQAEAVYAPISANSVLMQYTDFAHYPQPHLLLDLSHSPIPESTPDISYYTDGSKTSSGVGSGIFRSSSLPSTPCLESSLSLSKHCTVFQAESFALLTALKDIRTAFFSDCLSLLCTLSRHRCFHPIVHKCQILLYNLLPTCKITLHWVRGHSGIEGNCRADALAKIGAATNLTTPKYKLASKEQK